MPSRRQLSTGWVTSGLPSPTWRSGSGSRTSCSPTSWACPTCCSWSGSSLLGVTTRRSAARGPMDANRAGSLKRWPHTRRPLVARTSPAAGHAEQALDVEPPDRLGRCRGNASHCRECGMRAGSLCVGSGLRPWVSPRRARRRPEDLRGPRRPTQPPPRLRRRRLRPRRRPSPQPTARRQQGRPPRPRRSPIRRGRRSRSRARGIAW